MSDGACCHYCRSYTCYCFNKRETVLLATIYTLVNDDKKVDEFLKDNDSEPSHYDRRNAIKLKNIYFKEQKERKMTEITPETIAKRAAFLAYNASIVVGMGILQARDNVTEDEVWAEVTYRNEGKNQIYGDYVFGKMMKFSLTWDEKEVKAHDHALRSDYQSWSIGYKTYKDLVQAAIQSLQEQKENV